MCSFSILRNFQLESDVCRLPFAVYAKLKLSNIWAQLLFKDAKNPLPPG